MIASFLCELATAQAKTGLSERTLTDGLPRSTILRWQARQRAGLPLLQAPGPSKGRAPDMAALLGQVSSLMHGRQRSAGVAALYAEHKDEISRREVQRLVQEERDRRLAAMKRIRWLLANTAWAIDATCFHGQAVVPLYDLASHYRFEPLVVPSESGHRTAAFLDQAFRRHGAPLFLKRDNGSPFNCIEVDAVLIEHRVLPLNSPPHYPRYNGSMEKSIDHFKNAMQSKLAQPVSDPTLITAAEATAHDLNHRARRSLGGRTPCDVYHDPGTQLSLDRRSRDAILRLLLAEYCRTLQSMAHINQRRAAALWRHTVEAWLRCQGLISVGPNKQPNQNVSPIFPKKWSHN
jgi:hypothetical protein